MNGLLQNINISRGVKSLEFTKKWHTNLRMSFFCCNFAGKIDKEVFMAQETLNSLIAVMMTLSVQEQEQVISELQANVRGLRQAPTTPYTMEEINARLDESERDIEEGRYYTTDEVFHSQCVAV